MNKTKRENNYKFYCTSNPATWEINNIVDQGILNADTQKTRSKNQGYEGVRGRLSGGKRGEGGGTQREPDKGWEGRRVDMKARGNMVLRQ